MIGDEGRLLEVLEEIAEWSLEQRRGYIRQIGRVYGEPAAEQLRAGLTELWQARKTK